MYHLCAQFNPDYQIEILKTANSNEIAFLQDTPTLSLISEAYSEEVPIYWLKLQLDSLDDFTGVREKLSESQKAELSELIYLNYYYLKVSEIALFFAWLKSGKYGQFYGAVDPMKIMSSLDQFANDRRKSIEVYEQRKKNEEMMLEYEIAEEMRRSEGHQQWLKEYFDKRKTNKS